jgi:hypothetical protein
MTEKAAFNAEEWFKLANAPAIAALRVIAADRGGSLKESLSLGRAYAEARRDGSGLLQEIVSTAPQIDPSELKSPGEIPHRTESALREAIRLLEQKATPEETGAYKRFVLEVAETVARAHKEGGVLGIGGKEISDSEQAALDEIAGVLEAS